MHAYETHANEVHVHEVYLHEMHAHEMHAREVVRLLDCGVGDGVVAALRRQNQLRKLEDTWPMDGFCTYPFAGHAMHLRGLA